MPTSPYHFALVVITRWIDLAPDCRDDLDPLSLGRLKFMGNQYNEVYDVLLRRLTGFEFPNLAKFYQI